MGRSRFVRAQSDRQRRPSGGGGEFLTPPTALSLPEAHSGPRRSPRGHIQPDHTDHPPVDCELLTALPAWPWWRAAAVDRGDDHAGSSWIGDRVGTSAGEKPDRLKKSREYKPAGRHRGVGPRGGALLAAHGWPPSWGAGRCCPGVWKDSRRCCTWMEPAVSCEEGTHRRRAETAPSIHKMPSFGYRGAACCALLGQSKPRP
jgi:hypothetical protein